MLNFIGKGNQETMKKMLEAIREKNQEAETIIVVWDNHNAHLKEAVEAKARELGIVLVNLPAYCPDLNPIERIWKQVKKEISEKALVQTLQELEQTNHHHNLVKLLHQALFCQKLDREHL